MKYYYFAFSSKESSGDGVSTSNEQGFLPVSDILQSLELYVTDPIITTSFEISEENYKRENSKSRKYLKK